MIEWNNLFLVAIVAIVGSTVLVASFSLGMRWLTNARHLVPGAKKGKSKAIRAEVLNRSGAYMMFTICASALIYGIYLIVPYFNLDK